MSADVHSFYSAATTQHVKPHQDLMDGIISRYTQASNSTEANAPTITAQQQPMAMSSITMHPSNAPLTTTIISPLSPPAVHSAKSQPAIAFPQKPSLLKQIIERLKLEYYRYEVTLGVYPMTTGEKCVMNGFVMIVLGLMIWAIFLYFPSLIYHKLSQLDWLLTGRDIASKNVTLPLSTSLIHPQHHCFAEQFH